jgi:hypothetical protein
MWIIRTRNPYRKTVGFSFYTDYTQARKNFDKAGTHEGERDCEYTLYNLERDGLSLLDEQSMEVLARDSAAYRANVGMPII